MLVQSRYFVEVLLLWARRVYRIVRMVVVRRRARRRVSGGKVRGKGGVGVVKS
jgi:hypothetical protein